MPSRWFVPVSIASISYAVWVDHGHVGVCYTGFGLARPARPVEASGQPRNTVLLLVSSSMRLTMLGYILVPQNW